MSSKPARPTAKPVKSAKLTTKLTTKPAKPYDGFPLTAHPNGRWCKKIKGKIHYFGHWADWKAALKLYEKFVGDGGAVPTTRTLKYLCDAFLTSREEDVESGELKRATWGEYQRSCVRMVEILGRKTPIDDLNPTHFITLRQELAKQIDNPTTLAGHVRKLRTVLNWAYDAGLVDKPLRYRQALKKPPKRAIRKNRNEMPAKLFSAAEIHGLLSKVQGYMVPGILLAINCGVGNRDLADMEWSHIDGEYIDYPRPKTEIPRRAWMWPETRKALAQWRAEAPDSIYVACGERGQKIGTGESNNTPVSHLFRGYLADLNIETNGRGFYALRHTYRTIADACGDQPAINWSMGHSDGHISSEYRETIGDDRLKAVAKCVKKWLGKISLFDE